MPRRGAWPQPSVAQKKGAWLVRVSMLLSFCDDSFSASHSVSAAVSLWIAKLPCPLKLQIRQGEKSFHIGEQQDPSGME